MKPDRNATVAEVYAHPLGRDIIDKILLQTGRSATWVRNPLVSRLRLRQLDKFLGRMFGPGFVDTLVDLLADCPESPPRLDGPIAATWWKRAVFYQIYPRSFADSNGDGIGDLPGILAKLPYLDDLGIDCLWLSPIFTSPNKDMGYDIADYRSVMAEMGTIDDLRRLIAACHERGMRIILDLVANHTSDEHPWFKDALADPEGAHGDYYFLRDGDVALLASTSFLSTISCDISIEATKNTELFVSDTEIVRDILNENIEVRARAYEYVIVRLSEMLWKFRQMLFTSAERRLAKFLLAESARTAGDEIRLTHEETAQYLGTAREVVSRLIRDFSQEGLVQTSRGCIHILDRAALRERAGA